MSTALPLGRLVLAEADVQAVLDCLRSGWLTMGPRTQRFEQELAAATGAAHAVAVSSAAAGVQLALTAAGVGAGDEVLVSALAEAPALAAIRELGATPVGCDVEDVLRPNVDPARVAAAVTSRSRAVLAAHHWGHPCDLAALRAVCDAAGLVLVEDAAHALLADGVGAGDLTCYSLEATQPLGVGDGGCVTGQDEALVAAARLRRSHAMTSVTWDRHRGHAESYDVVALGHNFRLDEPRAALALSRLPGVRADVGHRRALVGDYRRQFGAVAGVRLVFDEADVEIGGHGAFGILLADSATRDVVAAALAVDGIACAVVTGPDAVTASRAPLAAAFAARGLRLPLSAAMDEADVDRVVAAVRQAVESGSSRL